MDSDDDDDIYDFIGTSLPELEKGAVIKKPLQDLTVRDEKGRQRFHGAFTGGFSAGYFNTVGTKEGWEPASFVSSRSNKSSSLKQAPEDFMDQEDFGQFGIAPKTIHTLSEFQDSSPEVNRKRKHFDDSDSVIPGEAPLKALIEPINESIGVQMLKKMGWRHGQGIGPKEEVHSKVIGCSLGPLEPDKQDTVSEVFTVAPKDTDCVSYVPKDNFHGIGYTGLSTHSILHISVGDKFSNSVTKVWITKEQRKLTIRGQAFGVGALEEDDDDIYSREDMSQYNFSEFTEDDNYQIPKPSQKTDSSMITSLLEGFSLASKSATKKKQYSLPDLPPGYKPMSKRGQITPKQQLLHHVTPSPKLNPAVRSVMLGENPFIKSDVQVQSTPKKRTSRFDQPASLLNTAMEQPSAPQMLSTITLSMPPLMSAKFKPFIVDELKQCRYEDFVKHGCDKAYLRTIQPKSLTEWEKQLELDEFTRTASFYQPLAKELDSRFESCSHLAVELTSGLSNKNEALKKQGDSLESNKESEKKLTPKRTTLEWHPAFLLSKRFNIPNPYPDSNIEGVPGPKKKKITLFDCISTDTDDTQSISHEKELPAETSIITETDNAQVPSLSESVELLNVESSKESYKSNQKPPMDLFKEIFKNSSSEESEHSDEETQEKMASSEALSSSISQSGVEENSKSSFTPSKTTTSQATSAPQKQAFGVFANLDFDALSTRKAPAEKKLLHSNEDDQLTKQISNTSCKKDLESNDSDLNSTTAAADIDFYGPELPPGGPNVPVVSSTEWISSKPVKPKSKHHKHKEHKKKKKKSKHKHLRSKEEDDSSSGEEEVLSAKIVETLKHLQNKKGRR